MCVHRTRQQLGVPDAIVTHHGSYALGENVSTDARMLLDQPVTSDAAAVFDMLRRGRPSELAAWDWFIPIEERLIATTIDLGLELAGRALREGALEKALEYAGLLTNIDPTSEEATEVLIRAHLERGERSLALARYQRLLRSMQAEMQSEPSLHIQRLVQ
jgi:DNA-binding SARP family transcriptional activator